MQPASLEYFCDIWLQSEAFRVGFSVETAAPRSFPSAHGRDFWLAAPASRERRILGGFPGPPTFLWGC